MILVLIGNKNSFQTYIYNTIDESLKRFSPTSGHSKVKSFRFFSFFGERYMVEVKSASFNFVVRIRVLV